MAFSLQAEHLQQVHRLSIGILQIFQDDHQRLVYCQQQRGDRAQQRGRLAGFGPGRRQVELRRQVRHQRAGSRAVLGQGLGLVRADVGDELAVNAGPGPVGGAVLLQAGAFADQHALHLGARLELTRQAQLAHAGRPRDHHQVALALQHAHQQPLQAGHLRLTPHKAGALDVAAPGFARLHREIQPADGVDGLDDLAGAGVAVGRLFLQQLHDQILQALRNVADQLAGQVGLLFQVAAHQHNAAGVAEGQLAGDNLVQGHAQRIQVGALVHLAAADQLGRNIIGGAAHLDLAAGARLADQAEIHQLDLAGRGDLDVAGFDVVMDQAARMDVGQGAANLDDDLVQPGVIGLPAGRWGCQVALGQAEQVLALDVLHGVEKGVEVFGLGQLFDAEDAAKIIHFHQVGVVKLAEGGELVFELRHAAVAQVLGAHQLERQHLVGAQRVLDQVDDPHAALAKLADDVVAMVNGSRHDPLAPVGRSGMRILYPNWTGQMAR